MIRVLVCRSLINKGFPEKVNTPVGLLFQFVEYSSCFIGMHIWPLPFSSTRPTIKGFGGEFEKDFDTLLKESEQKQKTFIDEKSNLGSGLTTSKLPPECSIEIALRHPHFCNYSPKYVAGQFVQGELGGPQTKYYDTFEYLVWLLSSCSDLLPTNILKYLVDGMKQWNVWSRATTDLEFSVARTFINSIWRAKSIDTFKFGKKTKESFKDWINHSLECMQIDCDPMSIIDKFLREGFIEFYFKKNKS